MGGEGWGGLDLRAQKKKKKKNPFQPPLRARRGDARAMRGGVGLGKIPQKKFPSHRHRTVTLYENLAAGHKARSLQNKLFAQPPPPPRPPGPARGRAPPSEAKRSPGTPGEEGSKRLVRYPGGSSELT